MKKNEKNRPLPIWFTSVLQKRKEKVKPKVNDLMSGGRIIFPFKPVASLFNLDLYFKA